MERIAMSQRERDWLSGRKPQGGNRGGGAETGTGRNRGGTAGRNRVNDT